MNRYRLIVDIIISLYFHYRGADIVCKGSFLKYLQFDQIIESMVFKTLSANGGGKMSLTGRFSKSALWT